MMINCMKVDGQINPISIDHQFPCFSWSVTTKEQNWKQKEYRILVWRQNDRNFMNDIVWDTDWIISSNMTNIPYKGTEFECDSTYYWKIFIKQVASDVVIESNIAIFETALMNKENWHGKWIGETSNHDYHIYRKDFHLGKEIEKAKLYICGLGHYELYMNGNRIGDRELEPGWTNYDKSCLYSVYDVTEFLKEGQNAMGAYLGDGMFHVPGGRYVYYERTYGKCKLLVQLNITFTDGSHAEIVTDTSWRMSPSPILFCCIYGGEDYDARLEQTGFSREDFREDSTWDRVKIVDPPKGKLIAQNIAPVKIRKKYQPVKVEETKPGIYLYDLGENFSGWVRIKLKAEKSHYGKTVTLTPGELLNASKEPDQRITGRGYHWQYTLNSKEEQVYAPKFTYTGFRYVQVEGAIPKEYYDKTEGIPIIEEITGEFIYPDVALHGEFSCSNTLFNQIHKIINQAILSNMKSILTDCPHREKLGWMEQTHLIGPAIMYNYDVHNLYEKIEMDMMDSQYKSGLIPDICPEYIIFGYHEGFIDSPEWGSACIINPWHIYQRYGDKTLPERYYDVMKKYIVYLTGKTQHHVLHHGLGDWLDIGPNTPYSQNTPVPVIATAIYYYDLMIMKQIAHILGYQEDEQYYSELMSSVYEEYNLQFFDNQTFRYATGSQAAQAMSLMFGLVDTKDEQKVLDYLIKDIKARGYTTTAGDIGHPYVIEALIKYDRSDIINLMTNITDKPGYGYQVKCGATTLTEEWDGPQLDRPHGSQNHLMLGSIEEWFYKGLAGIYGTYENNPFDVICIKPHFAKDCDSVSAWTMHPYGKVSVDWEQKEDEITVTCEFPPNTTGIFINEFNGSKQNFGSGKYTIHIDRREMQCLN